MTDTPVPFPPSRLEAVKGFIGDLARPFAIIATSASASVATVVIAWRITGFESAAVFIGAVYTGVAGIYGFKAWENRKQAEQSAQVEIAKVASAPLPPGTTTTTTTPASQTTTTS